MLKNNRLLACLRRLHGDDIDSICRLAWSGTSISPFTGVPAQARLDNAILAVSVRRLWLIIVVIVFDY